MKKNLPTAAFSLIEVILALGIFSFSILTLLSLLSTGITGLRQSMQISSLTEIGRSLSSEVVMLNYSDVTNSTSTFRQSFSPARYYDEDAQQTSQSAAIYVVTLSTINSQVPGQSPPPAVPASTVAQQLRVQVINQHMAGAGSTNEFCIWAIDNGR